MGFHENVTVWILCKLQSTRHTTHHRCVCYCYGPPGLPPKYPLQRHDTSWQCLRTGVPERGGV